MFDGEFVLQAGHGGECLICGARAEGGGIDWEDPLGEDVRENHGTSSGNIPGTRFPWKIEMFLEGKTDDKQYYIYIYMPRERDPGCSVRH